MHISESAQSGLDAGMGAKVNLNDVAVIFCQILYVLGPVELLYHTEPWLVLTVNEQ